MAIVNFMNLIERLRKLRLFEKKDLVIGQHYADRGRYLGEGAWLKGVGSPCLFQYYEGDRMMYISYVETDWDGPGIAVFYTGEFQRWAPPHDGEPVMEGDRQRIAARLNAAKLKWLVVRAGSRPITGARGA